MARQPLSTISWKLDLLIRLMDTTTGAPIDERGIRFSRSDGNAEIIARGGGNFVYINTGRENFALTVCALGYEEITTQIRYEELEEKIPTIEVFLIPSENSFRGVNLLSLTGNLPDLKALQAVNLSLPCCNINSFDARRCTIRLFPTHKIVLDDIYYGLIHSEKNDFEPIAILGEVSDLDFKLRSPLQEEFSANSPIARLIYGKVTPKGDYILRVRDNGEIQKYLVRYVVGEEVRFKTIDFRDPKETGLE